MTSLPTFRTWVFSDDGLLLNDWLLFPTRPVDLTARWSGSAEAPVPSSLGLPSHQVVQVMLYFGFPLLPIVTLLFVLVNLLSEAGLYHWHSDQHQRRWHPQTLHVTCSVVTLCLLTGVECVLSLVPSLSRYMPMWSPSTSRELEAVGGKPRNSLLPRNPRPGAGTPSMNQSIWLESDAAPRFLTQLPAVLIMQAVLRLVMIWITISLLGSRLRFISHIQSDSYHFLQYCLSQAGGDEESVIANSPFKLSQLKYTTTSVFHCSCSKRSTDNDGLAAVPEADANHPRPNSFLNMFRLEGKACRLVGCLLYTAVTVIVHLVLYLPQMWSFRLERVLLQLPENASQANSVNTTGWQLANNPGQPVGEYCLAIFGLLLPATLLVVSVLLLGVKSVRSEGHLKRQLSQQLLLEGYPQPEQDGGEPVLPTFINCYLVRLRWESCLIMSLGAIYVLFWLPRATTWQIHRIACLLNGNAKSSVHTLLLWPPQIIWLWSELASLVCNLISQLVLMISRSSSLLRGHWSTPELEWAPEVDPTELVGLELETVDEEDEEIEETVNGELVVDNTIEIMAAAEPGEVFHAGLPNANNAGDRSPCVRSHLVEADRSFHRPTSRIVQEVFYTGSCDTPCVSGDLRRRFMISPFCSRKYNSNQYLVNTPLIHRVGGQQNIKEQESKYHRHPPSLTTSAGTTCSLETNRVLLTYSPRSRHPFRPPRRGFHHNNNNVSMSPMSDPRSTEIQWRRSQSPPPLPPPPTRRRFSMIGDSSVYSTPHTSPKPQPAAIAVTRSSLSSLASNRVQFVETPSLCRKTKCGSAERDVQI